MWRKNSCCYFGFLIFELLIYVEENRFIIVLLRSAGRDARCVPGGGRFEEKKEKAKSEQPVPAPKKTSEYEKLFKEKHETADGMIRLHKVKGKLYFEFPVALLGRDMLLGSTVSEISDNGDAVIGSKPTDPLWIQFTRTGDKVQVRKGGPRQR